MPKESTFETSDHLLRKRSRIAVHALWDMLVHPSETEPDAIPWRPQAIDGDWLTHHLGIEIPGARVEHIDVGTLDHGSSVRSALKIGWNEVGKEAGLPTELFAKSTPTYLTRISSGVAARAEGKVAREVYAHLPIEAPTCVYSGYARASGRTLHLFEDLEAISGATFCHVGTKIDRSQANDIVDLLATLHGTYMGNEEIMGKFPPYENFFDAGARNGIGESHEQAMTQAAEVIPGGLLERRDEIWPAMVQARNDHALYPRTLIHSDVHLGNWYITAKRRMGLADWACVCTGLWARDLAYALSTTLTVSDRRAWEQELLERYHLRLTEEYGVSISLDEVVLNFQRQLFTALLMWTPTLVPAPGFPDMQPEEMSMEMIHRMCHAIEDHQALEAFKE